MSCGRLWWPTQALTTTFENHLKTKNYGNIAQSVATSKDNFMTNFDNNVRMSWSVATSKDNFMTNFDNNVRMSNSNDILQ